MAAIQTRRCVDVTAATYRKLVLYCEVHSLSMSSVVEGIIKPAIGLGGGMPSKRLHEQPPVNCPVAAKKLPGIPVNPAWRIRGGLSYTRWDTIKKGRVAEAAR